MDEQKQPSSLHRNSAAAKPAGQPPRPKKWMAHAGHGPVSSSDKGPHRRMFQGPCR